jgi:serine/threonine protein kinase
VVQRESGVLQFQAMCVICFNAELCMLSYACEPFVVFPMMCCIMLLLLLLGLSQEPAYPGGLSYEAVSFMMQAMEKNRQKRPSIAQLQAHPWFDGLLKLRKQQLQQQQAPQ